MLRLPAGHARHARRGLTEADFTPAGAGSPSPVRAWQPTTGVSCGGSEDRAVDARISRRRHGRGLGR